MAISLFSELATKMTDTYDRETSSKRLKRRNLVRKVIKGEEVTIDEADYLAYKSIVAAIPFELPPEADFDPEDDIEIEIDDEDKRIWSLLVADRPDLPEAVGTLSALKVLDWQNGDGPIPSWIPMLKNLKVLTIDDGSMMGLPREIGDLVNLEQLIVHGTPIIWLPPALGNLRKLKKLSFSGTRFQQFPEEYWNLSSLQELVVEKNPMSIPPSIERLKNLESLCAAVRGDLPKEIGNLSRLECLELNLLDSRLPSEIGNLTRLQRFKLADHDGYLPPSMANLKNLSHLKVEAMEIDQFDSNQLEVLKTLPNLEDLSTWPMLSTKQQLGLIRDVPSLIEVSWKDRAPEITQALSLNVYRHQRRNPFASGNKMTPALRNKLWPQMLDNATGAFKDSRYFMPMDPYDAVHKLLTDGKESFLQVLADRNGRNNKSNKRNGSVAAMEIEDCYETTDQKVARLKSECLKLFENNGAEKSDMFLKDMNTLLEKYRAAA